MNPSNYKRNELGLIEGVQYQFNEDGSINWRAMIKPEFLYPNKEWFEVRKMPVPETVEGLADHQLLVKLGGIKELARLRGFNSVQYTLNTLTDKYATAICEICWMPNYETCGVAQVFASTANATSDNCSGFGVKFLEAIAENRAFVRAVRNYLNIHIVGDDEIDKSKNKVAYEESEAIVQALTPHGALQNACRQAGYSNFEDFLKLLRKFWKDESYKNESAKDWKSFDDIPVKDCRKLLTLVSSCQSKE
jgi:hypothetical protein